MALAQHLPAHDAEALTRGGNQALIVLGEQVYQLRITRAGKLILTK
ncbi:hemin uptake protein HemP [Paracoccus sp. TK19116]|uniref:Hemin uptake protein HemP n=1 Tax=Paracoccus albicereus TaxID=2922394 RepID=A0ABT1MTK8_9RHOB|nr:hemin uptake protein HemP [Paracoccus albicereus]MCQ0970668.1 hemin uptake protein HemP [Paracoccus albicereus]